MKKCITTLACMLCLFGAPQAQGAGAQQQEQTAHMLEPVVVTAGRIEEKAKDVTQAMTVIPREEIEKNQYQDLGQILRNYGVQVSSYSSNESLSTISIRGMRTPLFGDEVQSPILVLVDGRRAGTTNVSMIPLVSIERVEIIRGPASVQYGASAIGGVVNVITRRGGEKLKISAEAGYGSWETWKTQAGLSGSQGPVDFAGGVSWMTVDRDYRTGDGRRYKNTQMNHRTSYALNTGVNFLKEHRLGVSLLGMKSEKMGAPDELKYNSLDAGTDRENHSVDAVYDGGCKDFGLSWKARYFSINDRYVSDDPAWPPKYRTKTNTQGSQGQISWNKSFFTLTAGLDWTNNDYRTSYDSKSEYGNTGGFLLAKAGLFEDKLILSAGLRYDDYSFKFEGREKNLDNVAPSVGLAWHALDWLTFKANYGEAYRIPYAMEVTGYDPGWGPVYHGNSSLKPEKGLGWDAGFEIAYKAFNLGLTYFQTDYKNKIATRPFGVGGDMQYYNISGTTRYRGIEGQASVDVGRFFDWPFMLRPYANITHMLQYDDDSGNKLQYVRNTDLAYGLNFQYPSIGLEADLRFTYFGRQKESKFDRNLWISEEITTGGATTADFFIRQTIWDGKNAGKLSVMGEVRNIFDKNYATVYGYPMPGRSFYIGLRYDY